MIEPSPPPPSPKPPADADRTEAGPASWNAPRKGGSAGGWMVTFTDLVALLLTFFVMIFAMSTVQVNDWQNLTKSLRRELSSVVGTPTATPTLQLDAPTAERAPGTDLDYLFELLQGQLRETPALDQARMRLGDGRLYVSLPADLLFGTGSHRLTDPAAEAVFAIGGVLRNLTNEIEVVGHADPRKPSRRFASNWELSLLRAYAVVAALRDAGVDGAIAARGRGDARFEQTADAADPAERRALARRVDLVIRDTAREPVRR